MTEIIDLGPAAHQLATLVRGVTDEQLDAPTPCPDYRVGDLLDHIGGLAAGVHVGGDQGVAGDARPGAVR